MYLRTVNEETATGEIGAIYADEREHLGLVMEATVAMTTRPEILPAWETFYAIVREGLTLSERDWKLVTLVAARHIHSTYCSLVYGRSLAGDLGSAEQVIAIQRDYRDAGLSARDVTMLAYAEQITLDASQVTEAHMEALRAHAFSDEQIFDIALCASLRNFMSRFYDAVGATPDPDLWEIQRPLRDVLVVGKPLPDGV